MLIVITFGEMKYRVFLWNRKNIPTLSITFPRWEMIRPVTIAATTRSAKLPHDNFMTSLQLVWSLGTFRWNIQLADLQMIAIFRRRFLNWFLSVASRLKSHSKCIILKSYCLVMHKEQSIDMSFLNFKSSPLPFTNYWSACHHLKYNKIYDTIYWGLAF